MKKPVRKILESKIQIQGILETRNLGAINLGRKSRINLSHTRGII